MLDINKNLDYLLTGLASNSFTKLHRSESFWRI